MKAKRASIILSAFAIAVAPLAVAVAAGLPPVNAKPLSTILTSVQSQDVGSIAEAEFDHGRWEVTTCKATTCQKLFINPLTGAEEGRRATGFEQTPTSDSTPIATVVQRIEAAKVGVITDVDFDHGRWEVKLSVPSATTP